jgi:hypothetical protein
MHRGRAGCDACDDEPLTVPHERTDDQRLGHRTKRRLHLGRVAGICQRKVGVGRCNVAPKRSYGLNRKPIGKDNDA